MGNRGCLHDARSKTLIKQTWTTDGWVICLLDFKGRHREIMSSGSYTELFFLDEATALAAGHRPCFECRRADALKFSEAVGRQLKRCTDIPATELNAEILKDIKPHIRKFRAIQREGVDPHQLPDGAMFALDDAAFLKLENRALPWSFRGYGAPTDLPSKGLRLTPRFTCAALKGGYEPQIDASAFRALKRSKSS